MGAAVTLIGVRRMNDKYVDDFLLEEHSKEQVPDEHTRLICQLTRVEETGFFKMTVAKERSRVSGHAECGDMS